MQGKVLYSTTLSSVIHNNEICNELVKISVQENYPIQKAKWQDKMESYVGFSQEVIIVAEKLPPIPGGWKVTISDFEPGYHEMLVPIKSKIDENGKETGEINRYVLQMLGEFTKEGLKIEVSDEYEKVYGAVAKKIKAWGHPFLLDKLDEFIENMR